MDCIWLLPELFYNKVLACPDLSDYFKEKVPKACFTRMMTEVITCIGTRGELSVESKNVIEKRHAHLHITHSQFLKFIELFMETSRELGIEQGDMRYIEHLLYSIESLFIFDDDDFRNKTVKRIDSILRDLSLHDTYNEVSSILQTAKNELYKVYSQSDSDCMTCDIQSSNTLCTDACSDQHMSDWGKLVGEVVN
jgi:truncated hemoglobin YjbI